MGFGRLLPFGQWVFDKSRGQLNTPVILHSICCVALCEPAATELKSKNTHGVSRIYHGVFYTDSFFDFSFWFCFWFLFWFWLYLARQWGFKTDFASAWALAFIRTKYWMISFSAAASGNACKSVWNLFASKTKVKKNPCQRLRVHPCNPWAFFWPSSCSRRLTGRIIVWLIYIHILNICRKITLLRCALWACGYRTKVKKHSRISRIFIGVFSDLFFDFRLI